MTDAPQTVNFDDLKPPETVTINIETGYGRKLVVTSGVLTYDEWEHARRLIPIPKPPKTLENPNKPGEFLSNPDDPAHKDKMREWSDNVTCYQVIVALERGGMQVPGSSPVEKARAFRKIENGILMALIDGVTQVHTGRKARVNALANSFPQLDMDTHEDGGDDPVAHPNGRSVESVTGD